MDLSAAPEFGLIVMFVVAAIPLLPTEAFVISAGLLASAGELSLPVVIAVAAAGCLLSDVINYRIGLRYGPRAIDRFERKGTTPPAVRWVQARLVKHGEPVLVAARFVPGGGIAGAVLAGTFRLAPRRFVPAAVVGSVLWSTYSAFLGYTGGQLTTDPWLGLLFSLVLAAVISIPLALLVQRAQRKADLRDPVADPAPR